MLEILEKYHKDGLLHKQIHPTYDLTIWNYSPKVQYEKLWDDITLQCRGLVTNSKGDIVARPFKKFFNYEEYKPEEIPNENYVVYEKMDGSLGILFKCLLSNAPAPYIAAPNPTPLAVANNLSSSAVRNCAAPKTAPTDPAPLNNVAIDISLPFSIISLNAEVMSALITSNFLGSLMIPDCFSISSIRSSIERYIPCSLVSNNFSGLIPCFFKT